MSFEALTLDKQELVLKRDEPIAPYTTFGIGGPADLLAEAYTERALQQVVREAAANRMRWLLIGGGSNLLVGDAGFRGLVIVNRIEHLSVNGTHIVAGAGADLGEVVEAAREHSLSGIEIVSNALEAPLKMIASNAGAEGSIVAERLRTQKGAMGYNAATGQYEDLFESGIVDPTKVTRSALQNAVSIASLVLTTEAVIADLPEEEKPSMPGGGMGGMD